ncbi:L,D-transpeptidase family protein [Sphingomonas sp.]|uniref:L,D-transpeptidase family protein n=1 Tax=Sphingomonas sp. TaxID=28214 RepID=UPI002B97E4AD|nr:L,D-transpeptidase family protein [Sphingomonas sp.]HTG39629.1 L,D-transpeptidase family protein [Sphingomonas sp.]
MVKALGQLLIALMVLSTPAIAHARGPAVNSVIALDSPLSHGEYAWDDSGVAAGPVRIVVDLATEKLHVYRAGVEIGRAFILYGADHKPTPTGIFRVLQKDRDHISNLYNAPMPYMLRLTWGGIAIHGSEVEFNAATHGCVGVPDEFAALLFEQARMGTEVLVTRNWRPDLYREEAPAPIVADAAVVADLTTP